jgi:Trk K+ transport system NAD-binding subunit
MQFQIPRVLAVVHDPDHEAIFTSFGIHSVVPVRHVREYLFNESGLRNNDDMTE